MQHHIKQTKGFNKINLKDYESKLYRYEKTNFTNCNDS